MKFKTGVFFSDIQAPYHLPQCVALLCEYLKRNKPELVIWGGDIVDFFTISHFTRPNRGADYLVDEVLVTDKEVVQPIIKAAGKAQHIWLEGNHEFRLKSYIANYARALVDLPGLSIQEVFKMKKRGIRYIAGKGVTKNGIYRLNQNLTFMHGTNHGIMAARKTGEEWGRGAVVQGHVHKKQGWVDKKGAGHTIAGYSAGCLCQDPDFGKGYDNYTRGFIRFAWSGEKLWMVEHVDIEGKENTEMFYHGDSPYMYNAYNTNTGWKVKIL